MNNFFHKFSSKVSQIIGTPIAFFIALVAVAVWAFTGPMFNFSNTWQLVINTGTTILTFLIVFLIQNTQNRDARAIHLKLDELIMGEKGARDGLVDIEEVSDEELEVLHLEFQKKHEKYTRELEKRGKIKK